MRTLDPRQSSRRRALLRILQREPDFAEQASAYPATRANPPNELLRILQREPGTAAGDELLRILQRERGTDAGDALLRILQRERRAAQPSRLEHRSLAVGREKAFVYIFCIRGLSCPNRIPTDFGR